MRERDKNMQSIKALCTEVLEEVEAGTVPAGTGRVFTLLVDAIEELSATIASMQERDAVLDEYAEFGGAELTI